MSPYVFHSAFKNVHRNAQPACLGWCHHLPAGFLSWRSMIMEQTRQPLPKGGGHTASAVHSTCERSGGFSVCEHSHAANFMFKYVWQWFCHLLCNLVASKVSFTTLSPSPLWSVKITGCVLLPLHGSGEPRSSHHSSIFLSQAAIFTFAGPLKLLRPCGCVTSRKNPTPNG